MKRTGNGCDDGVHVQSVEEYSAAELQLALLTTPSFVFQANSKVSG